MAKPELDDSCMFTSEELAIHIADTLDDQGLIDKVRFKDVVASITWELDAQHGMGRIALKCTSEAQ
jgi:hypothetical protein